MHRFKLCARPIGITRRGERQTRAIELRGEGKKASGQKTEKGIASVKVAIMTDLEADRWFRNSLDNLGEPHRVLRLSRWQSKVAD